MAAIGLKRDALRSLVERLGPDAAPSQIREAAYREGLGTINGHMLIGIRNALWPNRKKHAGGCKKGTRATRFVMPDATIAGLGRMHRRRAEAIAAVEKECSTCGLVLPVAEFGKRAGDPHLYRPSCRTCMNRKRAERGFHVKLLAHGMTIEQYHAMLTAQDHKCAICRSPGNGKGRRHQPLCIDHCHTTGKVRGLLCDRCNLGIGNFDDDVSRLEEAAEYIRRNN